jgi:hypothetical protein
MMTAHTRPTLYVIVRDGHTLDHPRGCLLKSGRGRRPFSHTPSTDTRGVSREAPRAGSASAWCAPADACLGGMRGGYPATLDPGRVWAARGIQVRSQMASLRNALNWTPYGDCYLLVSKLLVKNFSAQMEQPDTTKSMQCLSTHGNIWHYRE